MQPPGSITPLKRCSPPHDLFHVGLRSFEGGGGDIAHGGLAQGSHHVRSSAGGAGKSTDAEGRPGILRPISFSTA